MNSCNQKDCLSEKKELYKTWFELFPTFVYVLSALFEWIYSILALFKPCYAYMHTSVDKVVKFHGISDKI